MTEIIGDTNLGESDLNSYEKEQSIKEQQDKETFALLNDVENLSQADTLLLLNSLGENNPSFQEELQNFQDTNSMRVIEMLKATSEVKEVSVGEYFGIDGKAFDNLSNQLSEIGLDIGKLLNGYKNYLETNLKGIPKELKEKVVKSISIKVLELQEVFDDIKSKSGDPEELKKDRWIINERIINKLGFINKQLLPSLEASQILKSGVEVPKKYSDKFVSESGVYTNGFMPVNENYVDVGYKLGEIEELINSPVDNDGDFDEGLFSTQKIFDTDNKADRGLLSDIGVQELDLSTLNETDKEIQEKATLYFMALIGVQIGVETMGGVSGALLGGGVDLYDMFSKDEALLEILQSIDLVPDEYRMDKTMLDNILAGIGLIPGATQIIKGGKLAKFMEKVDTKVFDKAVMEIKNKLGIENIGKVDSIYDDPEYSFLIKYREILGEIKESDIISLEGKNSVIINNPSNSNEIIKISRGEDKDSLIQEFYNHDSFYTAWLEGREKGIIDDTVRIPYIKKGYDDSFLIIEKVNGQNLNTKSLLKYFSDEFSDYKKRTDIDLNKLSDNQIFQILKIEYNKTDTEIFDGQLMYGRDMLKNILGTSEEYYNIHKKKGGTPFDIAEKYISSEHGIIHNDLHPGNIILDEKGNVYLIDFGRIDNF